MGLSLDIKGLTFAYDGKRPVWEDISLQARPGEVLAVLGPNGTGKSTLLHCVAGLETPRAGRILADGRDIASLGRRELARRIAFVPQVHTPVFSFSALDVVVMGRTAHLGLFAAPSAADVRIAREALATMGAAHLADAPYDRTSGGERQLILFARALAQEAPILLLDEPTSHLDFGNQIRTLTLIRSLADRGLTVVMTTHFPDHAFAIAERTCLLARGRVRGYGPTREILTAEALSALYGLRVTLHRLEADTIVCTARETEGD